ncbi:MAG: Ig-like domain-containing protein, partial [Phycisphaerae bacterium]|nr:Ig-like domain-containing protein [Phycisphaerae bacterium]
DCNTSGVPDECELQGNDCNSNAVPDECDIAGATSADHNSNGVPDECEGPPTVIEQVPDGVIHQPISFVDVTFSDQIDGSTFGAEDVELVGPAGDIPVDPPVREDGNRWRISFAEQSDEGFHDLVIGPDVISLAGHGMTEAYAGEFCLVMSEMAFQVIDLDPVVTTVAPLMSAEVTFSRTIDAATFTVDDAVLVAPSGPVLIDSVTLLATNVFELTWAPQSEEGNYVLRIGPDIADVCAGLMDQDMDGTAGEVPDDVFEGTIMLNTSPPQIVSHNPAGVVNVPFGFLEVTFDEIIDPASFTMSDVELSGPGGSVAINSVLAQSGTVYRITFPSQTANGDYTFTIGPDILDQAGSSMTVAYQPTIAVALPDLAVTQIINPSAAGTGQTISVNWTVTNVGPFDAFGAWVDRVYLSDDAEVGGDVLLGSFSQSGPVVSGGDYVRIEMVTLPHDVLGAYWIVVVTDANNAVPESGTPDNNSAVGGESLLISDATDPETAITSGPGDGTSVNTTEVTFGWSGSDNATPTGQLEYSYCLAPVATGCDPAGGPFSASTTDSFGDLTEADSPYIFKVVARDEAGNVDPTPAQRSFSVDLTPLTVLSHSPNGVVNDAVCAVEVTFSEPANGFGAGDVTLTGPSGAIAVTTVVGAGSAEVFEFRFACQSQDGVYNFSVGPNIFDPAGNPMAEPYTGSFSIALPDLTPISLDVPSNGVSSGQIEVNWAVLNQGASSVTSAWKDAVYLSDDSAWGDDTLLGEFGFSGTLEVASTYNRTQNVTLPIMFEGTYWIIIVVDSRGNVPEQQEGADNRLVSAQSLEIVLPPYPDLQVGEMTGPPSAWPGQQVTLCWTVTNSGDESTGAVLWKDTVYFSTDQVIDLPFTNMWGIYDPGDAVLGSFDNQSSLGSGESYQQCRSVTIPSDVVGCYYFLARTDSLNQVFEYQPGLDAEANNDGGIESCCDVEMMPPPDLRVTMVNAPASGWSGQAFTLTWEVTNAGQSATPVHYWQDSVYLSLDETLDSSDTRIYTIPEGYPGDYMPPGHSYTRTYTYPLPRWIDGDYYVFVLTDSANHVNEQGWEGNNDWHDSTPMTINLTPPPDLEISYLSVSESALAGSSVVVDWMVTNYGGSTTYGHSQNPTVVH